MKSLVDCIKESLLTEAKFNVIADEEPETKQKDYIKIDVVDKNFELVDEVGFIEIKELGDKLNDEKTWLPDLGKYIGKNHGLTSTTTLSVMYWDEKEEDWVQFASVDKNGKILLWDPDAIKGENPFK